MEKSKLVSLAKKSLSPPPAAQLLQAKRAAAKASPPSAAPVAAKPPVPAATPEATMGDAAPVFMVELVEEAAEAAEAGSDMELEDAIAGYSTQVAEGSPPWAADADKWQEAAEAVGLGEPDADDRFEEPYAVAAYLYKKLGGSVKSEEGATSPEAEAEDPISKPGGAAMAVRAAMKQKALPTAPVSKAIAPKPAAPKPGAPAAGGAGEEDADLKTMIASAAQQADEGADPELAEKLKADAGDPPSWAVDAAKWTKAKQAVELDGGQYQNPVAVIAYVYKSMGGAVK